MEALVEMQSADREYSNRNVYDIIADICTLCRTPMKKTPLRNRVSASEKLLNFCVRDSELLETAIGEDGAIMYRTSTKGLQYLQVYDSLRQIMRFRMPMDTIFETANS